MVDLNAGLCALPVDLRAIVLSHVEHVKTRQILALSSTFREAFSLPGALPRTFDFEGLEGDLADHLVRLLDVRSRVRSLDKERVLELIGDERGTASAGTPAGGTSRFSGGLTTSSTFGGGRILLGA